MTVRRPIWSRCHPRGAPTRPRLDAGWDGAFGPNVDVPDEAGLVRWLHKHAWWWELPHNLDDAVLRRRARLRVRRRLSRRRDLLHP